MPRAKRTESREALATAEVRDDPPSYGALGGRQTLDSAQSESTDIVSRIISIFVPTGAWQDAGGLPDIQGDFKYLAGLQRRYYVALMAFLGFCNVYAMRVNLSIAIIEMTDSVNISYTDRHGDTKWRLHQAQFAHWSTREVGVILASFFYGYIITQMPGGYMSQKYGGRVLFGFGVLGTSILTVLTPPVALLGKWPLIIVRFTEGLAEGVTYPAMHAMWSHWAPPQEKTRLTTIAFAGSYFGTVISLPVSAWLGEKFGWAWIFYVFGLLGILWSAVWFRTITETPTEDTRIDSDELDYITKAIGFSHEQTKNAQPPWKEIMLSRPAWAITIAHVCQNWGFYTMLTYLPKFMKEVMGFHLEHASFVTAIPYLMMGVVLLMSGQYADHLRSTGYDTGLVRKVYGGGSMIGQAIFTILAVHCPEYVTSIMCITLSIGLGGIAWSGFSVNHLDIAPQYACVLMGLSNTFATLPGMISPILVGIIVEDGTLWEWRLVFYMSASVYAIGGTMYWWWASGDQQVWALVSQQDDMAMTYSQEDDDDLSERRASQEVS